MIEIIGELNNYLNIEALTKDTTLLAAVIIAAVIGIIYCFSDTDAFALLQRCSVCSPERRSGG